jgi:GNAT superfamily N-acetyltransferase
VTDVVIAEDCDLDVLCDLMAEAFFDLSPSAWLIADETARREIFPSYFRIFLENGFANGYVDTTIGWAGAAVWLPVGTEPPRPPLGYHQRLTAATAPWTSRFIAFDAVLEARHPVGKAHHHLALLGVRPGRQGRGIGTALLEAHHHQLDTDGLPAYLEASSPGSRKLYLRHGYADLEPPIPLPGGPSLYPMWREPKGGREREH